MAGTVGLLREWLSEYGDEAIVGIDDGGLTLIVHAKTPTGALEEGYYEIGGMPRGDAAEEDEDDGERRCDECGESFNTMESGNDLLCLKCTVRQGR